MCGPGDSVSIDGYWHSASWPLRQETNNSGKNVILVAPTLGPRSEPGILTEPQSFESYIDKVLTAISKYGPHQNLGIIPTCRNIVLACHSGGGKPMRQLALANHRYSNQISECWGFDCLYNATDPKRWAKWAEDHKNARLFIHYLGTEALSEVLRQGSGANVSVEKSTAKDHCLVPVEHWQQRIKARAFLN